MNRVWITIDELLRQIYEELPCSDKFLDILMSKPPMHKMSKEQENNILEHLAQEIILRRTRRAIEKLNSK